MKKTTLCYIKKDDSYLMLFRNKKLQDENEGKWVGVGGKFEKDETADECLLREVFEETGLTLTSYTFHGIIGFHSDEWGEEDMYLYSADAYTGDLVASCPEGELRFIKENEILSLPMWEGDKYFLAPLLNGETDIKMDLYYKGNELVEIK
ncbi:MAG: 8-oxo-dGTP diphosphatase [Oscillospiraceae bacterium]|nr:8-oxo-dGTP diphosphatase [Candidatus Limimonas coprohippi]MCQ2488454.1 8-oxo-dGTP diphosphatase [Clostridia bacterium]